MAGKPKRFNEPTRNKVLEGLRAGFLIQEACEAAAITPGCYSRWMRRGELAENNWTELTPTQRETERPYIQFREDATRALTTKELLLLSRIDLAAQPTETVETTTITRKGEIVEIIERRKTVQGDWRADAWQLEHCFGGKYAKSRQIEISGKDGGPVQISADLAAAEELLARLEAKEQQAAQ